VDIEALCGEKKVCGKCIVRVEEGHFEKYGITSSMSHVSPWQEEEDKFINPERKEKGLPPGLRGQVEGDILVFVPEESRAGKAGGQQGGPGHPHRAQPGCQGVLRGSGSADLRGAHWAISSEFAGAWKETTACRT
jgi:ferredoxin